MATIKIDTSHRDRQLHSSNRNGWREYHKEPRLYVSPKDETVLEQWLHGRHNRPVGFYRKNVVPVVLEKLGLRPEKVQWSQKAGCPCGCSPGFILRGLNTHKDYWAEVSITAEEVKEAA